MVMCVDDVGHAKGLPVNPIAIQLYGNGWPILGTAVVFDDRDAVLPRSISEGLSTEADPYDDIEPDVKRDPTTDVEISDADGPTRSGAATRP